MTTRDFKARIAAIRRAQCPQQNGAYHAPQLDAATIMRDLQNNISRPAHDVRGPTPPTTKPKGK
jgi:hypothetical protein